MTKTRLVRQLRHGQITIPKEFREALGLEPEDLLAVTLADDHLEVTSVKARPKGRGSAWARELHAAFEGARRSLEGYSEQEINDAIDEALAAVRARGA